MVNYVFREISWGQFVIKDKTYLSKSRSLSWRCHSCEHENIKRMNVPIKTSFYRSSFWPKFCIRVKCKTTDDCLKCTHMYTMMTKRESFVDCSIRVQSWLRITTMCEPVEVNHTSILPNSYRDWEATPESLFSKKGFTRLSERVRVLYVVSTSILHTGHGWMSVLTMKNTCICLKECFNFVSTERSKFQ